MTTWTFVFIIVGCALVTWLPRILPFIFVKKMELPSIVLRWLQYIPVCILSALVFESFFEQGERFVVPQWDYIVAFIPTALVAIWTKSLSITVVIGVVTMALLRFFG